MIRRTVVQDGLILLGMVLGIAVAYVVARAIQVQEAHSELDAYATRLVRVAERYSFENQQAIEEVSHDHLPFCSDEELAFMRDYVFRSPHIRDIGRTKDGKLYCSTGVGRIDPPKPVPVPDVMADGTKLYVKVVLMISNATTGFIVERDGVSLVLNPNAIQGYEEPPKQYTELLIDRPGHRLLPIYGPAVPMQMDEVLAGKSVERNGILYQAECSHTVIVCQVTSAAPKDMMAKTESLFTGFLIGGALLGTAGGVILVLYYARQRSFEQRLRRAIRKGQLTAAYQPVVLLSTRKMVAAEALARWVNESGETVRPDVFVALAEEKGFVTEITRLMLRKVMDEVGDLLRQGDFRVTLNTTAQDLALPSFFAELNDSMAKAGVKPAAIGLELTERSTVDQNMAIHAIAQLRQTGHSVYIDDFGTGYSSLAYLHQLAVTSIKVDRAFTKTVGTESVTASVVPQILEMAEKLKLMVVVEGIETEEQAEYFLAAGEGILGQGWLFGKPLPAAEFRARYIAETAEKLEAEPVSV